MQWITSLKMKERICKKQHGNRLSWRPTSITIYISTIMWCSAGLCKTKWAKIAQDRNYFWPSLVLGQSVRGWPEGAGAELPIWSQSRNSHNQSLVFLWHKSKFSYSGGFQQPEMQNSRAWLASWHSWLWNKGNKWRKCHPSFPERQVGQGNQFPCFSTGEWFILLAAGCRAVQRRRCCQGAKPFWSIPRKCLMRTKHLSIDTARFSQPICVILLGLVRMWCHIMAKNWLQNLREEPELECSFFAVREKKKSETLVSQGFIFS